MKSQTGSSRVDTVLKMMLIAFISLLAFSSGVWFGKSLSDSDHKLKALESDFSSAAKTAQMDVKKEEGQEDPLAEEEVANLSEKFVTDQRDELSPESKTERKTESKAEAQTEAKSETKGRKVASEAATKSRGAGESNEKVASETKHPAASARTTKIEKVAAEHTAKSAKPDLTAAHAAAERVAHNAAPEKTAEEINDEKSASALHSESAGKLAKGEGKSTIERAPSSAALPKTVGTAGEVEFTVQVASYPTADAAKVQASELVKKGFPAFPVEATVNGRTWFRVSVGSFKTMREAATYRTQLLKQAELTSAIVQRIQR